MLSWTCFPLKLGRYRHTVLSPASCMMGRRKSIRTFSLQSLWCFLQFVRFFPSTSCQNFAISTSRYSQGKVDLGGICTPKIDNRKSYKRCNTSHVLSILFFKSIIDRIVFAITTRLVIESHARRNFRAAFVRIICFQSLPYHYTATGSGCFVSTVSAVEQLLPHYSNFWGRGVARQFSVYLPPSPPPPRICWKTAKTLS